MANEEQLAILKKGVGTWNEWRAENPGVEIDLRRAILNGANLFGADLSKADFTEAYLKRANLMKAILRKADLSYAQLGEANLKTADLEGANLSGADLSKADLRATTLHYADISDVDLAEADLTRASMDRTFFSGVRLTASIFLDASMRGTIILNSDLSEVIGLEDVVHWGPSIVSTTTIALSKGKISEAFLKGCGLSDWEIASVKLYKPDLSNHEINETLYKMYELRAGQALQISNLFISYSHADSTFVDKIESHLDEKGIRYWRDIHDMKSGRMEKQIDRAIRQNPTVLLILSEHSIKSDWVEHEVRTARVLEKEIGRDVLCPVALDDSWKSNPWPRRVMEQVMEYNILDFSAWTDDNKFERMFRKLIDGLELFYKG